MQKKKGFTLVEIVMVTVILGLLTGVIFRIYIAIATLSLTIKQEEEVFFQAVFALQNIQNITDHAMIDYDQYDDLASSSGIVDTLFLKGDDDIHFYLTGENCGDTVFADTGMVYCHLQMQQGEKIIDLTDPNKIYMRNMTFKIIPYNPMQAYYDDPELCSGLIQTCLYTPGFWMIWEINSPKLPIHDPLLLQQFFTLQ